MDTTFDSSIGADGPVRALAIQSDGKIVISGEFGSYNAVPVSRLARLHADGSLDTSFNPGGAGLDSFAADIEIDAVGRILLAGAFRNVNGVLRARVARLNSNGSLDSSFTLVSVLMITSAISNFNQTVVWWWLGTSHRSTD